MALSALQKSEIALNEAKLAKESSEAELNKIEAELSSFELLKTAFTAQMEATMDFRSNYIVFDEAVDFHSRQTYTATFRRFSRMKPGEALTIELNSAGGEIVEGFALFDEILKLRRDGHHVTIRVRGNACSMAAVLLQAADKREIGPNAFLMIHRAAFGAVGSAFEVEDNLELVKRFEERIKTIFTDRTGKGREVWDDFFKQRRDIWFDAKAAVDAGLVDEIV